MCGLEKRFEQFAQPIDTLDFEKELIIEQLKAGNLNKSILNSLYTGNEYYGPAGQCHSNELLIAYYS